MLHTLSYIVPPALLPQLQLTEDETVLLETPPDADSLLACYRASATLRSGQRFGLLVQISSENDRLPAGDLVAFFFFPNYLRYKGSPCVYLQTENVAAAGQQVEELCTHAALQGFPVPEVQFIGSGATGMPGAYAVHEGDRIASVIVHQLHQSGRPAPVLYIRIGRAEEVAQVRHLLQAEENKFQTANSLCFALKEEVKRLSSEGLKLETALLAAKQEIENMKSHIALLRSSAQATELQHYYNNEYEILPLWYKRFGHLLKVAMGKRSFRSIFSEKEKKYKQ